jgi:hypothetical protein
VVSSSSWHGLPGCSVLGVIFLRVGSFHLIWNGCKWGSVLGYKCIIVLAVLSECTYRHKFVQLLGSRQ